VLLCQFNRRGHIESLLKIVGTKLSKQKIYEPKSIKYLSIGTKLLIKNFKNVTYKKYKYVKM